MASREGTRAAERVAFYDQVAAQAFEVFRFTGRVLDIGCGSCWARSRMPDAEYVGIDPVDKGQEFCGIAESLPFPDNHFDGVLCYSVLQHVMNPEKAMQEAARVLRSGGYFGTLIAIDSQDPIFLNRFSESTALKLVRKHFRIDQSITVPGMYEADGSYLILTATLP